MKYYEISFSEIWTAPEAIEKKKKSSKECKSVKKKIIKF
jgi:hypothetical protein